MTHIASALAPQMGSIATDAATPRQRCFALHRATLGVGATLMLPAACALAMLSTSDGCDVSMSEGYDRSASAGIGLPVEKPRAFGPG